MQILLLECLFNEDETAIFETDGTSDEFQPDLGEDFDSGSSYYENQQHNKKWKVRNSIEKLTSMVQDGDNNTMGTSTSARTM